ncbi:MAG: bifunctional nuclease family protein [Anaerolineae bacterium]|nr:bifunctional nuclease family protein [Anaerolineae bacterium]
MIEVKVDTVRARLTGYERLVLLKEIDQERQLPIFIGRHEADAISIELKAVRHSRPFTHDLLVDCITALGGELEYVLISELRDNVFFALLHVVRDGVAIDIDARSSDGIAVAVRAKVPIYVAEAVMEEAGVWPAEEATEDSEQLAVFRDFVDTLDLDDLGDT